MNDSTRDFNENGQKNITENRIDFNSLYILTLNSCDTVKMLLEGGRILSRYLFRVPNDFVCALTALDRLRIQCHGRASNYRFFFVVE